MAAADTVAGEAVAAGPCGFVEAPRSSDGGAAAVFVVMLAYALHKARCQVFEGC